MAEIKTKKTEASVEDYLNAVKDEQQKKDCLKLLKIMKKITKTEPKLWSHGAVGFGDYAYKSKSGQQGNWYLTGFSPRKQNISIMLMAGFNYNKHLLEKLGKHKTGAGCLYINSLQDIDTEVLEELIRTNLKILKDKLAEQKS